jgi:hypothetical protein
VSPFASFLDDYSSQPQPLPMTSEFRELWRWYVAGRPGPPNSSSTFGIALHLFKLLVLWSAFFFVLYRLIPRQYWPFYKGILANPLLLLLLPCLYVRSIIMDFLSVRLEQRTAPPKIGNVLTELSVLDEYRRKYGKSDFFYRFYVSIGWVALGCLMVGGLYWFFSLPK